jgi:hypothetical protein
MTISLSACARTIALRTTGTLGLLLALAACGRDSSLPFAATRPPADPQAAPTAPATPVTFAPTITVLTQGEQREVSTLAPTDFILTSDVRYTVDDPSVATVDESGTLQTLTVGTTRVDVMTDAARWSTLVTVAPLESPSGRQASPLLSRTGSPTVWSISITTGTSLMEVGQAVQFQAVARDSRGNVLPNAVISWSSSANSVISMTTSGMATSVAPGETFLIARSGTVNRAVRVTSEAERIRSVRVTPATVSLTVGESVQLVATPLNLSGQPVSMPPGVRCTFSSSAQAVMRSNLDGLLFAITAGSAAITASCMDRSAQVPATVVELPPGATPPPTTPGNPPPGGPTPVPPAPNPGPSPGPVAPSRVDLPRVWLDTMVANARASTATRSVPVRSASELQAALDNARSGDDIVLTAGQTYTGSFTLRRRPAGPGWVTIRSSGTIAAGPGVRMRPSMASSLARLSAESQYGHVLKTEAGAAGYRLVGIEITVPESMTESYPLVELGESNLPQNTLESQPRHIVLDRMYIHGHPTLNFRRCVALNSASTAIVDSWISECHARGADAQAIGGWNGTGPFMIHNNYLEGSGETLLFGGADMRIPNYNPGDIDIRRNHLSRPPSWRGVWLVKNHLQLKAGVRVLIEGNVIEENWADGQIGFAVQFNTVNQDGAQPWAHTGDVTFRNNIIRNSAMGISLTARHFQYTAVPTARVVISNNLLDRIGYGSYPGGRLFQVLGVPDLTIENNTGLTTHLGIIFDEGQNVRFRMENNIFGLMQPNDGSWEYAVFSSQGFGQAAIDAFAPGGVLRNNVIPSGGSRLPVGNFTPTLAEVGFVTWPSNLRLQAGSTYTTRGPNSTAVGVDFAVLDPATAGVVTGR